MRKKSIFIVAFMLLILSFSVMATNLPIVVKPRSSGSLQPSSTFNYEFNLTSDSGCSTVILGSGIQALTTNDVGEAFYDFDISSLTSTPAYLCEYKSGSLRATHTLPSSLFTSIRATNMYIGSQAVATSFDVNATGVSVFTNDANYADKDLANVFSGAMNITGAFGLDGSDQSQAIFRIENTETAGLFYENDTSVHIIGENSKRADLDFRDSNGTRRFQIVVEPLSTNGRIRLRNSAGSDIIRMLQDKSVQFYGTVQADDNLTVSGTLITTGGIEMNQDDTIRFDKDDTGQRSLYWSSGNTYFTFENSSEDNILAIKETGVIMAPNLVSCDSIDTDASGNFACGTDADTDTHQGYDNVAMTNETETFEKTVTITGSTTEVEDTPGYPYTKELVIEDDTYGATLMLETTATTAGVEYYNYSKMILKAPVDKRVGIEFWNGDSVNGNDNDDGQTYDITATGNGTQLRFRNAQSESILKLYQDLSADFYGDVDVTGDVTFGDSATESTMTLQDASGNFDINGVNIYQFDTDGTGSDHTQFIVNGTENRARIIAQSSISRAEIFSRSETDARLWLHNSSWDGWYFKNDLTLEHDMAIRYWDENEDVTYTHMTFASPHTGGQITVFEDMYLTADQLMTIEQNTTAIACAGKDGAIAYFGDKHYGCDGTNWNALY